MKPGIELEDEQIVHAEFVDGCLDVFLQTQQDRRDDNGDRHADHHPEHSQDGSCFICTNSFQRHLHVFGEQAGMQNPHVSNLRASMGSRRAALRAGYTPKNSPTAVETRMAMATA